MAESSLLVMADVSEEHLGSRILHTCAFEIGMLMTFFFSWFVWKGLRGVFFTKSVLLNKFKQLDTVIERVWSGRKGQLTYMPSASSGRYLYRLSGTRGASQITVSRNPEAKVGHAPRFRRQGWPEANDFRTQRFFRKPRFIGGHESEAWNIDGQDSSSGLGEMLLPTQEQLECDQLIAGWLKVGDIQKVEACLQRTIDAGNPPIVRTWNRLLQARSKLGDTMGVESSFEQMLNNGVSPDMVTYTELIRACAWSKDVQRAEFWFCKMQDSGMNANLVTHCAMLNVCAKAGDVKMAEIWFEKIKESKLEPNAVCYNCVIDACVQDGDSQRAELWLRRLIASPNKCTAPSFTTTAQAFALQGDVDNTERILAEMEDYGLPLDSHCLTVLLSVYNRTRPQMHDRAVESFREYVRSGMRVTKPPIRVLRSIIGKHRAAELCEQLGLAIEAGNDRSTRLFFLGNRLPSNQLPHKPSRTVLKTS